MVLCPGEGSWYDDVPALFPLGGKPFGDFKDPLWRPFGHRTVSLAVDLMKLPYLTTQRALLSVGHQEKKQAHVAYLKGEGVPRAIRVTTMKHK